MPSVKINSASSSEAARSWGTYNKCVLSLRGARKKPRLIEAEKQYATNGTECTFLQMNMALAVTVMYVWRIHHLMSQWGNHNHTGSTASKRRKQFVKY